MHATQCPWFMRAVTGSSSDHFFRMAHLRGTENYTRRRKGGERESCVTDMQFFLWISRMPLTSPPGDIAKAMFAFHKMKPFQRLFHTEYSESSELLFYGSSGNLHGMVNSTADNRVHRYLRYTSVRFSSHCWKRWHMNFPNYISTHTSMT